MKVTLTCEADGATSYNWERQSGSISSGAIGVNTNTLTIINLQPEDAGNYRCVATNASGSGYSEYATVIVKGDVLFFFTYVFTCKNSTMCFFANLMLIMSRALHSSLLHYVLYHTFIY